MGEPFNRDGQVYPANQPGVGTQYDPHPPAEPAPVLAPEVVVTSSTPGTVVQPDRHGYTGYKGPRQDPVQPGLTGPGWYADGTPIPVALTGATDPDRYADGAPRHTGPAGVTGATGESFLQHLEDEIKAHI